MASRETLRIYVGYTIVRKTDTRLSRGEDVVVCLPGARIEHVTERVEQIMGRGYGGTKRRDKDDATRKILQMTLDGKRNRGRPKLRWRYLVKDDMARNHDDCDGGRHYIIANISMKCRGGKVK